MPSLAEQTISWFRSDQSQMAAVWFIFVSLIIIRILQGHFPPQTKRYIAVALLGLLRLWLQPRALE